MPNSSSITPLGGVGVTFLFSESNLRKYADEIIMQCARQCDEQNAERVMELLGKYPLTRKGITNA